VGVVDEDVQRPESLDGRIDDATGVLRNGDVLLQEDRCPIARDLGNDRLALDLLR